jgi:uncharacterized repeat protein (TIGR02543 family)
VGDVLNISAKVKYTTGPSEKRFYVTAIFSGTFVNLATGIVKKGEWGTLTGTYTVPSTMNPSTTEIFVETPWLAAPTLEDDRMNFYTDDVSVELVSSDVTYTVSLDPTEGTVSKTSVQAEKGKGIGILPIPERAGYTFAGWYSAETGGQIVTESTRVSSDVTIYAHWEEESTSPTSEPSTSEPPASEVPASEAPTSSLPASEAPVSNPPADNPSVSNPPSISSVVTAAKGTKFKAGNLWYKIVTPAVAINKSGIAVVTGSANKSVKKISVPALVKYKTYSYRVSGIAKKAFRKCKKLTSATIGKNIERIENSAFEGCIKLKKIVIISKKLSYLGKNAIKKIKKNSVIKVPKSKRNAYKKEFTKKTGYRPGMKIK